MLQNCSIIKILEVFFDEPTKTHYLKEISKKSKLAHTSTKNYLNSLKKDGIIIEKIEKRGKRNFPTYILDLQKQKYKNNKKIYNFYRILNSGLINFLGDKSTPKSIVLF